MKASDEILTEVRSPPPSLGLRALAFAQEALAAGVREHPAGSNRGPEVDRYLRGCVRHGDSLVMRGVAWCAAFASWCVWNAWAQSFVNDDSEATRDGCLHSTAMQWTHASTGKPPIGYRAAVAELVADAEETGTWRDISRLSLCSAPRCGDLLVMGREGADPRAGGTGHVGLVERGLVKDGAVDATWDVISGNDGDRVRRSTRTIRDTNEPVVGWISLQ